MGARGKYKGRESFPRFKVSIKVSRGSFDYTIAEATYHLTPINVVWKDNTRVYQRIDPRKKLMNVSDDNLAHEDAVR